MPVLRRQRHHPRDSEIFREAFREATGKRYEDVAKK